MSWYVIQTLMGTIGSIGFAILFGVDVRDRKLAAIGAGGALGWIVYLISTAGAGTDMYTGLLFSSLAVSLLAEYLARKLRTPVILLLVPMLIPLIPGGDLYNMMALCLRKEYEAFGLASWHVLFEAGAIAVGIIVGAYAARAAVKMMPAGR